MLDGAPISYWIGFHILVLILIVVDLAILGRGKTQPNNTRNLVFVVVLVALATAFCLWIGPHCRPPAGFGICLRLPDRALAQHR